MQRAALLNLLFFVLVSTHVSHFAYAQDSNGPSQSQGDNQQQQQQQQQQQIQQQQQQQLQQQQLQIQQQQQQLQQQRPAQPPQQPVQPPQQPVQPPQQPVQPPQQPVQPPQQPVQPSASSSSSPRRSLLEQRNGQAAALEKETRNKVKAIKSLRGINAVLETSFGNIKIRLFNRRVPKTVYNFVSLAEGTQAFRENSTKEMKTAPFYDGLTFHRVVPKYVIQTGDPLGTGRGGPGYKFEDEPHPALRHKKAGIVSMANFGPNTNGSQFFITLKPMPDLDFDSAQNVFKKRGNTIFGEVTEGMEVVRKISEVPRDNFDKPLEAVILKRVIIHRQK